MTEKQYLIPAFFAIYRDYQHRTLEEDLFKEERGNSFYLKERKFNMPDIKKIEATLALSKDESTVLGLVIANQKVTPGQHIPKAGK